MKCTFFRKLRSELFPCPGCGCETAGPAANMLCETCRGKLHLFSSLRCPGCGGPLTGALALCEACLAAPKRPWQGAVSVFEFEGYGRELVHRLKFGGTPELARPLGLLLGEALKEGAFPVDCVTAVPLHWRRYWSRSFNQSKLTAKIAARELHLPYLDLLRRIQGGAHQSSLSGDARRSSVRRAFVCPDPARAEGRIILLVDDVFTSGFTLAAAADTLLKAGCRAVYAATVARTPRFRGQ